MQPETPAPGQPKSCEPKDPFPWPLALAALAIAVCVPGLSAWPSDFLHDLPGGWAVYLGDALVLAIFFWCLWKLYRTRFEESPLALTVAGLICADWLGIEADRLLDKSTPGRIILAVLFVLALFAAKHWRRDLECGRSLRRTLATEYLKEYPIRALVLFVSKPNCKPEKKESGYELIISDTTVPLAGDLQADMETLDKLKTWWNWQQLLRAIEPHVSNVGSLWLVGSKESCLPLAEVFLSQYFPKGKVDIRATPAVDLENFDHLFALLRFITLGKTSEDTALTRQNPGLAAFLSQPINPLVASYDPKGVAVDITGGIKVASITGAVLTLNHAVVCQYVQSAGLDGTDGKLRPYIYDFRWDKSLVMD